MFHKIHALMILFASLVGLSGCAPPDVPPGASTHWSMKEGFTWTWTQELKHGCTSWIAKEKWAYVELLVEAKCNGEIGPNASKGRGVSYSTPNDYLIFQGYWPWSANEYFDRIIADSEDNLNAVRSCGYQLSAKQLMDLRIVGQKAFDQAQTPGERRVLARIKERLANIGSGPLSISQVGCVDLPLEGKRPPPADVWQSE